MQDVWKTELDSHSFFCSKLKCAKLEIKSHNLNQGNTKGKRSTKPGRYRKQTTKPGETQLRGNNTDDTAECRDKRSA